MISGGIRSQLAVWSQPSQGNLLQQLPQFIDPPLNLQPTTILRKGQIHQESPPCKQHELQRYRLIPQKLLRFFAFVAIRNEEAGHKNNERCEDQTTARAIAVQNDDSRGSKDALVGLTLSWEKQFTVSFKVVVRSHTVNVILQGSQNLGLVDTDQLFKSFHFLLAKGFNTHCFAGEDVVQSITEIFDPAIHVFDFRAEEVAGSEDEESVVVEI